MMKTVAVIGAATPFGLAISSGLAAAGYPILLTACGETQLRRLLFSLRLLLAGIKIRVPHADVRLVLSETDASWEADIVLAALPREEFTAFSPKIRDVVRGKIVVCLTGRLGETQEDPGKLASSGGGGELAGLFPHSKIIRAAITSASGRDGESEMAGKIEQVLVSGDDQEALSCVVKLIGDAGFRTVRCCTPALH